MALTPAERAAARAAWLTRIRTEIERRNAKLTIGDGDHRRRLFDKLAEMRERLRGAPDYIEPAEAKSRRATHQIERWLRRRGYGQGSRS